MIEQEIQAKSRLHQNCAKKKIKISAPSSITASVMYFRIFTRIEHSVKSNQFQGSHLF